jgi:hypothetical protein
LQISANGHGTRVELLQFSDDSLDTEFTDVASNQSPKAKPRKPRVESLVESLRSDLSAKHEDGCAQIEKLNPCSS